MKNNYASAKKYLCSVLLALCSSGFLNAQLVVQTYTFTGAIQNFTVPQLCVNVVTIEARGAQGGNTGGLGASMRGTFSLNPGQVLKVLVGGQGGNGALAGTAATDVTKRGGGGGGGSFVTDLSNVPLVVAGGGGGYSGTGPWNNLDASTSTSGGSTNNNGGGVNGNGGASGNTDGPAAGGGGLITNGVSSGNSIGGSAFINGGAGGSPDLGSSYAGGLGGFGGGGAGWHNNYNRSGGGGGYSGGQGGTWSGGQPSGAGGGSFNSGANQVNTASVQSGHGLVVISYSMGTPITTSMTPNALCAGASATLSAGGMVTYTWSNGSNATNIVVSPNVTTNYTVQGTNTQGCVTTAIYTVNVASGPPVLAIVSSTNQTCLGKSVTLTATGALSYTWTNNVTNGASFTPSVTNTYTVYGQNGCGTSSAVTTVTVAPLPVTLASSTPTVCAGKAATLTSVSGATGFTWQPVSLYSPTIIVSPTVNTVYSLSITDGTCTGFATLSVSALPVPTIGVVASATQVCAGSPAVLNANGGINYTWSPGNMSGPSVTVFPTGPTLYTVTGDNSVGCLTSSTQIVLTSTSPAVNVSADFTFTCKGDNVNLFASGNAATYQWTGGPQSPGYQVSPVSTTIYTVTGSVSTNTCVTIKTITITVFDPVMTVTSSTNTVCSGEDVILTATGADTYLWVHNSAGSNMITENPVTPTVYSVTGSATSNGLTCPSSGSIQISVNPNPTVTATSNRTLICKDEKTTLVANGALDYLWSTNQSVGTITVAPLGITIHSYSLTGTDQNGCVGKATISVRVIACNGLAENADQDQLMVYPNPSAGEFSITSGADLIVRVINALGQEILSVKLDATNDYRSEISGLPGGLYFITVDDNKALTKKIVIK